MANVTAHLKVSVAWWLKPYLYALAAFYRVTGFEPDMQKLEAMGMRAMSVKVVD